MCRMMYRIGKPVKGNANRRTCENPRVIRFGAKSQVVIVVMKFPCMAAKGGSKRRLKRRTKVTKAYASLKKNKSFELFWAM